MLFIFSKGHGVSIHYTFTNVLAVVGRTSKNVLNPHFYFRISVFSSELDHRKRSWSFFTRRSFIFLKSVRDFGGSVETYSLPKMFLLIFLQKDLLLVTLFRTFFSNLNFKVSIMIFPMSV